jgi:uncharacterized membrane protein
MPLPLAPLDALAVGWFCFLTLSFGLLMRLERRASRTLTGAIHEKRIIWMRNMANRENRMMDVVLLQHLSTANTFFASTSVLLLGGLAAMLGSGERVQSVLERLPYVASPGPVLLEVKIVMLMALLIYAFFKFAWAFRLTHYTAIMVGATPLSTAEASAECADHVAKVAELAGLSAEHANAGLRTYYFAIAGMTWFLHPVLFIVATTWVTLILLRREYISRSRAAILGP